MTSAELEAWNTLPPLGKAPAFYRLWMMKEACSKYDGLGLGMDFTRVAMTREDSGLWRVSDRDDVRLYCRELDESTFLSVCVPAERATEAVEPVIFLSFCVIMNHYESKFTQQNNPPAMCFSHI